MLIGVASISEYFHVRNLLYSCVLFSHSLPSAHFLFELVVSSSPRTMTTLRMHTHTHVMTERSHTCTTSAHVLPPRL